MQKVVGSNPIIRSSKGPAQTGLFVASIGTMTVCSTSLEPGVIDHKYYARGVGTALEQQPHRLLLASEDRQVQRREAVVRERAGLRRISVEAPPEGIEPPERGGLEHRQLLVRRQQLVSLLDLPGVQSFQRLAHALHLLPMSTVRV